MPLLPAFPPSPPPSNIQAQFAASVHSVQADNAKFYHPLPPAWEAAVGWLNPARLHRMAASTEFHSVGPCLGNAPKCRQILLYQLSSPSTKWCDLHFPDHRNLLQGGDGLLWAAVVAVLIMGFIRVVTVASEVGKVWIDSWRSLWNKERFFQPAVTWSSQFDMAPHHSRSEQCSAFENRNSNKPLPFLPAQFTEKIFWLVWKLGFLGFFPMSV